MTVIDLAALAPERVRPMRRVEYDRLVALDFFGDEKVELLDGIIVAMSPVGTGHAYAVQQLNMLLTPILRGRAIVRVQSSLAASEYSEPEPDVLVAPRQDYSREHPVRALLVIEVSESSLRKDRRIKSSLYARGGVPEYWIVDVAGRAIEVYRAPVDGAYSSMTRHEPGEIVRPQAFDDVEVPVSEIVTPA